MSLIKENKILTKEGKRRCSKCLNVKSLLEFSYEPRVKSKTSAKCKVCERGRLLAYSKLPEVRAKTNAREKLLLKNDSTFTITKRVRRAIRHLLSDSKFRGSTRYLPYSMERLRKHLESLFVEGMSWDNRNEWHIDHIIALRAKNADGSYYWNQTDLADPTSETFKKAWALENLQPLWEYDNCALGARRK